MSDYREIRVRLNLEHPQDRWLAAALEERTRELGAPLARVVRRALTTYLRNNTRDQTPGASSITADAVTNAEDRPVDRADLEERGVPLVRERPATAPTDPWVRDDSDQVDIGDNLASMGIPPEPSHTQ